MKNLTDKVFSNLVALSPTSLRDSSQCVIWLCKCSCGTEAFISSSHLLSGHTKSCGCLHRESARNTGYKNKIKYGEASFNDAYNSYKRQAFRRNLTFDFTKKQFRKITSENCFYCGVEPRQVSNSKKRNNGYYMYNGIDRINNSLGYILDNCVPCCKNCNIAKGTKTLEEFMEWINKLIKYNERTGIA